MKMNIVAAGAPLERCDGGFKKNFFFFKRSFNPLITQGDGNPRTVNKS